VSVILGPVTTKFADAVSPLLPFTVTMYVPGVIGDVTVKLAAEMVPVESIEHETEVNSTGAAGDCRKLQRPASATLKPWPVTATAVPLGPVFGFKAIVGPVVVTTKA
jgi:hypothetical protein